MPARKDDVYIGRRLVQEEPALQSKKKIDPPFMKTVPAKFEYDGVPLQSKKRVQSPPPKTMPVEPVMQSKKRVVPNFAKTDNSDIEGVPIQSKKRVASPPPKAASETKGIKDWLQTVPVQSEQKVENVDKSTTQKRDSSPVRIQTKKWVSSPVRIQTKKQVETVAHTNSGKSETKPVPIQTKKKVEKVDNVVSQKKEATAVPIQSKKKVEQNVTEKSIHTSQPYMQSKKRTPGPPVTLNKEFNEYYERSPEQEHDFVLLGSQDKFSKNVKYKISSSSIVRDSSPPKQMKFEQRFQKENKVSRAKDVSPAPVVNTDKYKKPLSTPLAPRQEKSHTDVAFKEMKQSNVAAKEPKMAKEVPREPKYSKEPKVSKTTSGQVHQSASEVRESKARRDEAKNLDRADPVKNSMKAKSIGQTNAFAQTSMEQGIARSAPEAPADYAFKYKTGMTAPRPSKKQTEYQKQFPWRENFRPASPLLKAEQELLGLNEPRIRRRRAKREVVYNSNPQLVPPRKSTVNKLTEYQKQFREYKLIPADEDVQVSSNKKRSKLQRSKSMEDLAPAEIQAAGIRRVVASCNKRLILSSDQVQDEEKYAQPVEVPRRKQRQVHSEYDSNFRSPTKFDYVRGSWQGAAPPQIQMKKADEPVKSPVLVNWFAEVIELRRKAQEYRKRAQGTHFSREHLAQLMAQQNTMWETSTQAESATARSYLSALSLESGLNTHTKPRHTSNNDNARNRQYREADSTAATMATDDDCSTTRLSECDEVPQGKKLAWGENDKGRETPSTFTEDGCSDDEGGVIIPRKLEPKRRHHFDRTTPNQEGAVLASSANAKKRQSGKRMVNKSVDSISLGEEATPREYSTPVHRPLAGQATYTAHKGAINTSPTFGMPSRDTHLLRDDGYYADQELRTKYVVTPARSTPGGLGAIEEGYGQTYSKSNRIDHWAGTQEPCNDIDDDVLSVSMQSIASSCSLASATLERARKRKDDFWGPKGVGAK